MTDEELRAKWVNKTVSFTDKTRKGRSKTVIVTTHQGTVTELYYCRTYKKWQALVKVSGHETRLVDVDQLVEVA